MGKKSLAGRWIIGNEEDGANLWTLGLWAPAFLFEFPKFSRRDPFYHVFEFKRDHFRWFIPEAYAVKIGNALLALLMRNPKWFAVMSKRLVRMSDELYQFSRKVLRTNVKAMSNHELAALFNVHERLTSRLVGYGMLSTLADVPLEQLTKALTAVLEKRVKERGLRRSAPEYFVMLSPLLEESIARKEYKALLHLYARGAKKKDIEAHVLKFSWAYYGYEGPAFGADRVRRELAELKRKGINPRAELSRLGSEAHEARAGIKRAERELILSLHERALFQALRDAVFMKMYRKDACSFSFFAMESAVREVARRARIPFAAAKYIVPGEHGQVLAKDRHLLAELPKRIEYCVYSGATLQPFVLIGNRARQYIKKIYHEGKVGNVRELKGQPACVGKAVGTVRIVNTPKDMTKMRDGDILVSIATTPDIVPAMKKAAAIVTDLGGVTSHASIVSRELGIPCIIGTKIATKVLKDGDRVEVDAERGVVRKV